MVSKDLSFLVIREDDSDSIIALKTKWQLLVSLPKPQRLYQLQLDKIREEESYLKQLISWNKEDSQQIKHFTNLARQAVADFQLYKDVKYLEYADSCLEVAKSLKKERYSVAEIRLQRERVQWEKQKLKEMKEHK